MSVPLVSAGTVTAQRHSERIQVTLNDFEALDHSKGAVTKSPELEALGGKWHINCYPGGDPYPDFMVVYLAWTGPIETAPTDVCFLLRVVNQADPAQSRTQGGSSIRWTPPTNTSAFGWSKTIERSLLMDPEAGFLVDGRVILEAELTKVSGTSSRRIGEMAEVPATLSRDLASSLECDELSDVGIKCGGQTFRANKLLLAARSPVLNGILKGGIEASSGEITIEDMEPEVLKQMLRFIYTDDCEEGAIEAMADHLLVAACRYQLGRLQVLCEVQLSKSLTAENAADRLALADRNDADQLREDAVHYMSANIAAVRKSEGYQQLSRELLMEVTDIALGLEESNSSRKRAREDDRDELSTEDVKRMKVGELRAELSRRGLDVDGVKPVLVSRLEAALGS